MKNNKGIPILFVLMFIIISSCASNETIVRDANEKCAFPLEVDPSIRDLYEVDGFTVVDEQPIILESYIPQHPQEYQNNKLSGTVLLSVQVGVDGTVEGVSVIQSDLPESYQCSAANTAMRFKWEPGKKNGAAVTCLMTVPMRFGGFGRK